MNAALEQYVSDAIENPSGRDPLTRHLRGIAETMWLRLHWCELTLLQGNCTDEIVTTICDRWTRYTSGKY